MPQDTASKPRTGSPHTGNIGSHGPDRPRWDGDDIAASLAGIYEYVVSEAVRAEAWYWQRKRIKARGSQVLQWSVIALTGLAGIVPISIRIGLFPGLGGWLRAQGIITQVDSGLLTSLLLGLSAALIGFDRVSGLSSGWTRYVLTASSIRSACEEFRMDWTALLSRLSSPPQAEEVANLLQRAKTFRMGVEALVVKETQDWATEFHKNLAQIEKDLKLQVDQARAAREKLDEETRLRAEQQEANRVAAEQPGGVEAIVLNAAAADGFKFEAALVNNGRTFTEVIESSQTWALLGVPAGQYKLTVRALVKKSPVASSSVLTVKPNETTKAQLTLPTPPAGNGTPAG